jgi:hypothetical protein
MSTKFRELRGLAELLAFTAQRTLVEVKENEYNVPGEIPCSEGSAARAEFTDGSTLYVVTSYDAEVFYWVREA